MTLEKKNHFVRGRLVLILPRSFGKAILRGWIKRFCICGSQLDSSDCKEIPVVSFDRFLLIVLPNCLTFSLMHLRNESLFHLPLSMIWVSDAPFIFISVANVTLIEWRPTSSSGIPSLSCPKILTACFRGFSISFDFNLIVWKGHFAWLN